MRVSVGRVGVGGTGWLSPSETAAAEGADDVEAGTLASLSMPTTV